MSARTREAGDLFAQGCSCSQAVFLAFAEEHCIDRKTALKLAGGFGGGMGRLGEACGAVTGSLMVLGLQYGCDRPEDRAAKERTYEMVRKFAAAFESRNGSILCRNLLGFDLSTGEGKQQAAKPGSFDRCPALVRQAVEILEEMLGAEAGRPPSSQGREGDT